MRLSLVVRSVSIRSLLINSHTLRTHNCGQLRLHNAGEEVTLMGWVAFRRLNRFLVLRDSYGSVQATVREDDELSKEILCKLPYESVVCVKGKVRGRGQHVNPKMDTGEVEVEVSSLAILNPSRKDLPFLPDSNTNENTRLKYRYIDLRSPRLQSNLRLRSSVIHEARRFLVEQKAFVDVETPTLFRPTPGGAAEFIVPSRMPHKGLVYSLPQSPQQFKQLLMVGAIDRYFQVARCYRDEGSKADRQPEFTQLDIEMSFCTQDSLMNLLEETVIAMWPPHLLEICPSRPFPRMKWKDAMRDYGVDKPDLRVPWKIEDVSSNILEPLRGEASSDQGWVVRVVRMNGEGKKIGKGTVREWKRLVHMNNNAASFALLCCGTKKKDGRWLKFIEDDKIMEDLCIGADDALLVAWGEGEKVQWTLGHLRSLAAETLGIRATQQFRPLWVVDFPLFERIQHEERNDSASGSQLASCHHPFTAPVEEDRELLGSEEKLESITAQHFDLVMNGVELGGGSMRIHNGDMQRKVLRILREPTHQMTHLLEALDSGAPPHGGFAFGIDRLISLFAGMGDTSYGIRDVIAFPKSKEGRDVMVDAPVQPTESQLKRYGFLLAPLNNDDGQ